MASPKNDVALELYYGGAWHDLVIADDVLAEQEITIQRGDGAESAAPRPAQLTARLNNDDDDFRTSNPESPLYGLAGRNTPVRVKVGGVVRCSVEATSWRADQTRDFRARPKRGKAWVDLEAGGLMQRVNGWTEPLRSALTRQSLKVGNLLGLFPLEDDREATRLSNLVADAPAGGFTGTVTLASDERPGGAASSVQMGSDGFIGGRFLTSTASGWQFTISVKLSAVPASGAYQEIFRVGDSIGRVWAWEVSSAGFAWRVYDSDGSTLSYTSTGFGATASPDQWIRYRTKVTVSGSTITLQSGWYAEGAPELYGKTDTFSGTSTGRILSWRASANTYTDGACYTNVYAVDQTSSDLILDGNVLAAFEGFVRETPGQRFQRLMTEEGLPRTVLGDVNSGTPMGPQPVATLAEHLRECRDTDDGLLFDSINDVRLIFATRDYRFNQTAVSIDVSELRALPQEVTDDLGVHNLVTVENRDGGEATSVDETGPLGTASPPTGVGEYRHKVDVNVNDEDDLPGLAAWWRHRGTVNLPRFPSVVVNLFGLAPARIAQIEAIDVGDVIEITGYREYVIRLYVIGYTEKIAWPNARWINFTCAPDQQFDCGTYNGGRRYSSATTTVKTALSMADTAVTFRTTDIRDVWSTTATPYDVMIAGQRSTVTSMGAASLVSGAYDQAAILTRGVDGIRKAIAAGEPIRVANKPGRYAR